MPTPHISVIAIEPILYDGVTQQCQYTVDNTVGRAMGEKKL